jgi:hypothetical protein
MSAPSRKRTEMLVAAVHRGSRKPPPADDGPTAGGTIKATVAELYADLERHRGRVVEIESLISKLENCSNGAPSALTPAKHRGGRPVIDPNDALRARKAADMRARRAKIRAAATLPSNPKLRKRQKTPPAAPVTPPSEPKKSPPAPPPAANNGVAATSEAPKKLRRQKAAPKLTEAQLREIEEIKAAIAAATAEAGKFKLSDKTKFRARWTRPRAAAAVGVYCCASSRAPRWCLSHMK